MVVGRPLGFDPNEVKSIAMELFWERGYENTSLLQLIEKMGISKSSFYTLFESKHSLFVSCLEEYIDNLTEDFEMRLGKSNSGIEFISQIFAGAIDVNNDESIVRGCLVINSAVEMNETDELVSNLLKKSIGETTNIFEKAVIAAQLEGDINKELDARSVAAYLVNSISGLRALVKTGVSHADLKQIVHLNLSSLN